VSSPSEARVVVVGAGIVGAACAEALAQGGCDVTVLEGALAGTGTTAAAMGHVVVMDDSDAQLALCAWSRRLWVERAASLPSDCEDAGSGTLWVAANEAEMARLRAKAERHATQGGRAELLDPDALRDAEPELRPDLPGALHVPEDRVVYPLAVTRHLLDRARALGARVRERSAVERVEPRRVRTARGWEEADVVVVAAGGASPRLLPELPIEPRRGHLVITDRYPGFLRHQVIEVGYGAHPSRGDTVAFNVQPRTTGQLLIGSSRENVGWGSTLSSSVRARMVHKAREYVPGLARLRALRSWVGFRPATPDGLPLIGQWEPGLLVAAGHEGLGITTSLGTARIVADLVQGRDPEVNPAPFDPRRRELHRG
jgi:glycine/D-amino acid oxidase-like deaminating enzyme